MPCQTGGTSMDFRLGTWRACRLISRIYIYDFSDPDPLSAIDYATTTWMWMVGFCKNNGRCSIWINFLCTQDEINIRWIVWTDCAAIPGNKDDVLWGLSKRGTNKSSGYIHRRASQRGVMCLAILLHCFLCPRRRPNVQSSHIHGSGRSVLQSTWDEYSECTGSFYGFPMAVAHANKIIMGESADGGWFSPKPQPVHFHYAQKK